MRFFSSQAELKNLIDISSCSFEFAKELIRHNLVSSSQALAVRFVVWGCVRTPAIYRPQHWNLSSACCRWCFVEGRAPCRCCLLWSMSSLKPGSTWSSTISDKVRSHDGAVLWTKQNKENILVQMHSGRICVKGGIYWKCSHLVLMCRKCWI